MSQTSAEIVPMPVELAPGNRGLVRAAAPIADVVAAQNEYHALCGALLDRSDYQRIGSKDFAKKSAWRKLAVAFNVSVAIVDRDYERDDAGRIIRAEVIARATAPNGRTMDGLGACDLFEKCCPGGAEGCPIKAAKHRHCRPNCPGSVHFSNSSHDLPATAATRATNRACADLFGMGEVSAEEVGSGHVQYAEEAPAAQVDPVTAAGWPNADAHDAHRKESDAIVKTLPEAVRTDIRDWVNSNTEGYRTLWTTDQASAYRALVTDLAAAERPQGTPGAAQEASAGASTQPTAESPAPAPQDGASSVLGASDLPEYVKAIVEEVKAMSNLDVLNALDTAGLDCEGDDGTVRARLVEHRAANAPDTKPF